MRCFSHGGNDIEGYKLFVEHIGDFPIPEDVLAIAENSGVFEMSVDDEVIYSFKNYFKSGGCHEYLYLLISRFVHDYCEKINMAHAIHSDKFIDAAIRHVWNQIRDKELALFDDWGDLDNGGCFIKSLVICTNPVEQNGKWRREVLAYSGINGESAASLFQDIHYLDEMMYKARKTYYFSWLKKDESYENKIIAGFLTEKKNGYVITEYPLGDDVEFFKFPDEIMALI